MDRNEFRSLYRARISYELAKLEALDVAEGENLEAAQFEAEQYLELNYPSESLEHLSSMPRYS